ncbi:VIN3-like protein 2 isoform X2 [Ananas comosus]|uniref:VIN3-like protein 2 isoform X2 n=1 Tax=Ananas comosus TaxID=4615 RepID=A0A6P5G3E9_ANACO|nr:VIN3-like protein 2 isoform X2 [Ananas comosus]
MESIFSGYVIDPSKCSELSLAEKRDLVHEICRWAENAPEILQSWSRKELLQLICAEMGKERKYTGVTKPKMIELLLRLVSQNNRKRNEDIGGNNQTGLGKKRKKEYPLELAINLQQESIKSKEQQVDKLICQNVACRASLSKGDAYCKRCSCSICFQYDDNKDPSLWLVCSSEPPYSGESCAMSCHLKCALKHEKTGILKNGCNYELDGSFYCICCGKVNWLIRSWRKQLAIAGDARRVDVLCDRLSLVHKMLKGTERYKELEDIVTTTVKKLKKEVGPLDKVSTLMGRAIVNRLNCGAEVQRLCSAAVEAVDSILCSTTELGALTNELIAPGLLNAGPQLFQIHFEEISPFSVAVSLQSLDNMFEENIIGCTMWHRCSNVLDYPEEPTCLILRPERKVVISGLTPSTEYYFKVIPFSSTKELGKWEAKCLTQNLDKMSGQCSTRNSESTYVHEDSLSPMKKEQWLEKQSRFMESDSQKGSTNSSEFINSARKITKFTLSTSDNDVVPLAMACKSDRLNINNGTPDSAHKKDQAEQQYEYCVKVIRRLECEGHMEKEFRVKFLTWFSLKATAQERRVVSAFIDVLIDEPASLVAQLVDAFMDGICNKEKPPARKGFCTTLWH